MSHESNHAPEFDPMHDLARALEAHFRAPSTGDAASPATGAPLLFALPFSALFGGKKVPHPSYGHVTMNVMRDDDGVVFESGDNAGGIAMQLAATSIDADNRPHESLGGQRVSTHVVRTQSGWFLAYVVEMDDEPEHNRIGVVSLGMLAHRMWHTIAAARCDGGGVALPGDELDTPRDASGRSVRDILDAALSLIIAQPRETVDELTQTTARSIADAITLLHGSTT